MLFLNLNQQGSPLFVNESRKTFGLTQLAGKRRVKYGFVSTPPYVYSLLFVIYDTVMWNSFSFSFYPNRPTVDTCGRIFVNLDEVCPQTLGWPKDNFPVNEQIHILFSTIFQIYS